MYLTVCLLISVIFIYITLFNKYETFDNFRLVKVKYDAKPNLDSLKGLMFDTRFPTLSEQKHLFNDTINKSNDSGRKNDSGARLNELAINLNMTNYAKIPEINKIYIPKLVDAYEPELFNFDTQAKSIISYENDLNY